MFVIFIQKSCSIERFDGSKCRWRLWRKLIESFCWKMTRMMYLVYTVVSFWHCTQSQAIQIMSICLIKTIFGFCWFVNDCRAARIFYIGTNTDSLVYYLRANNIQRLGWHIAQRILQNFTNAWFTKKNFENRVFWREL